MTIALSLVVKITQLEGQLWNWRHVYIWSIHVFLLLQLASRRLVSARKVFRNSLSCYAKLHVRTAAHTWHSRQWSIWVFCPVLHCCSRESKQQGSSFWVTTVRKGQCENIHCCSEVPLMAVFSLAYLCSRLLQSLEKGADSLCFKASCLASLELLKDDHGHPKIK